MRTRLAHLDDVVVDEVLDAIERARVGKIRFEGHDGKPFRNKPRVLPRRSSRFYREWTAAPSGTKRGDHRVIFGGKDQAHPAVAYYWDHASRPIKIHP